MKKVLITGANSFIGVSFENWMKQWSEEIKIKTIDMKNEKWKEKDFSEFDTVFHVAGISHVSTDLNMEDLYYKVNRDLAIEVAKKAKADGVKQFIFMSSILVYGNSSSMGGKKVIDRSTLPIPRNFYGKSKLQAEKGIQHLADKTFKIVILRPPMIYGKGAKGNYPKLAKIARKFPIFPNIENERSMLYIDNLCEFIRIVIEQDEQGIFFPQNREYTRTSEMVQLIAEANKKKIKLIKIFNPLLKSAGNFINVIDKVFGSLVYEKKMSEYHIDYRVCDFKESILATEK